MREAKKNGPIPDIDLVEDRQLLIASELIAGWSRSPSRIRSFTDFSGIMASISTTSSTCSGAPSMSR